MGDLKEFSAFREELSEHVDVPSHSMPPNILILRRQTVRQFPNNTMVALYYNDKLKQYFSIPYGGQADSIVTPVALAKEEPINEISQDLATKTFKGRIGKMAGALKRGNEKEAERHHEKAMATAERMSKKPDFDAEKGARDLSEGVISHLERVKSFQTDKPLFHHDGSQTKIDPQTANALLTVHGALHPTNQKKFTDAMEHSKTKFHKMVDFAWKQVK